mmetsp:Transcript_17555/g.31238  ORF Transcript_17555/g.31238 Transcript_17555/m.31238 type:complete len:744 (-) Transcript_17555:55-2286(-)
MAAFWFFKFAALLVGSVAALEQPEFEDDPLLGNSASEAPLHEVRIPEVQLKDLESRDAAVHAQAASKVHQALSTLGAVTVAGAQASHSALEAWAKCLLPGGQQRASALVRPLADGFVRRLSASAQDSWTEPVVPLRHCDGAEHAEKAMRLGVRAASRAVLGALDEHLPGSLVTSRPDGREVQESLVEALEHVQHLEHLHLYEEAHNRASKTSQRSLSPLQVLDTHTDAGLLLAFVPPVSSEAGTGPSLEVETTSGQRAPLAAVHDGTVIFFVGEAAKLLYQASSEKLRPLPHALRLPIGFNWRAWFGTMLLLPDNALIRPDPRSETSVAFGGFWREARMHFSSVSSLGKSIEDMPIGCGSGLILADQAGACEEGQIYCWMQCMSTKGLENCSGGAWRSSGKGDLAEWVEVSPQCRDPIGRAWPHETGEMCPSCKPACTMPRATANSSSGAGGGPGPHEPDLDTNGFCVAMASSAGEGTVMYMEGFRWTSVSPDATCLAFFYGHWVIDSPLKLALSCMGAGLLGITMEILALCRRHLPVKRQRDLGVVFHALNLSFAYLVMLIIMMYSLELFLSVITGLVFGHVVTSQLQPILKKRCNCFNCFDANNSVISTTEVQDLGAGSPCCRMSLGLEPSAQQNLLHGAAPMPAAGGPAGTGAQEVTLLVSGMTCSACVGTIERRLQLLQGVVRAEVNLSSGCARVQFDPPASVSRLCSAIEEVGFDARPKGSFSASVSDARRQDTVAPP